MPGNGAHVQIIGHHQARVFHSNPQQISCDEDGKAGRPERVQFFVENMGQHDAADPALYGCLKGNQIAGIQIGQVFFYDRQIQM